MHWSVFLVIAIVCEVFGSTMLKLSQGFSKPLPSIGFVLGFGLAFYLLSLALKSIPLGMASIGLILAGVIMMNTLSKMGGH